MALEKVTITKDGKVIQEEKIKNVNNKKKEDELKNPKIEGNLLIEDGTISSLLR